MPGLRHEHTSERMGCGDADGGGGHGPGRRGGERGDGRAVAGTAAGDGGCTVARTGSRAAGNVAAGASRTRPCCSCVFYGFAHRQRDTRSSETKAPGHHGCVFCGFAPRGAKPSTCFENPYIAERNATTTCRTGCLRSISRSESKQPGGIEHLRARRLPPHAQAFTWQAPFRPRVKPRRVAENPTMAAGNLGGLPKVRRRPVELRHVAEGAMALRQISALCRRMSVQALSPLA